MTAYERIIDALRANGSEVIERGGGQVNAQCPAHDDGRASLSVGPRGDGNGVVLHCHANCDYTDVLAALGLSPSDLFDEPRKRAAYAERNTYDYPDGRRVHRSRDANGKRFRQSGNTKGTELFHAERITADTTTVYVPEGEKENPLVRPAAATDSIPVSRTSVYAAQSMFLRLRPLGVHSTCTAALRH
jgi:hypothetical protein